VTLKVVLKAAKIVLKESHEGQPEEKFDAAFGTIYHIFI
jgi:hypothetical protein